MAKKARRKSSSKSRLKAGKKSRKSASSTKRKKRRAAKRKGLTGTVSGAYRTVVDTFKGTDQLRNRLEKPGTSETE